MTHAGTEANRQHLVATLTQTCGVGLDHTGHLAMFTNGCRDVFSLLLPGLLSQCGRYSTWTISTNNEDSYPMRRWRGDTDAAVELRVFCTDCFVNALAFVGLRQHGIDIDFPSESQDYYKCQSSLWLGPKKVSVDMHTHGAYLQMRWNSSSCNWTCIDTTAVVSFSLFLD